MRKTFDTLLAENADNSEKFYSFLRVPLCKPLCSLWLKKIARRKRRTIRVQ